MYYIIIILFVIIIAVLLVYYILVTYNKLSKLNIIVEEGFLTMDIYLEKRWDMIPKLVEVVKSYAEHEKNTLEEIVRLRDVSYDDISHKDKININMEIDRDVHKLLALAENYPDLASSNNFLKLSGELVQIEDNIADSRRKYNLLVKDFNDKAKIIPNNLVALIFGFKEKRMFIVSDEEKNNIDLDF